MAERIENQVETPDQKSFWELLTLLQKEGMKTTDGRVIMVAWTRKNESKEADYKYGGSSLSTGRLNWWSYIEMHATWLLAKKPWDTDRRLDETIIVVFAGKDGKLSAVSQKGVRFPSAYPIVSDINWIMKSGDKIAPENIGQVLAAMKTAAQESVEASRESIRETREGEAKASQERDRKRREDEATRRAKEVADQKREQKELLRRL